MQNQFGKWQQTLASHPLLRRWWVFWAIYSVLILFALNIYVLLTGGLAVVAVAFVTFVLARFVISPAVYFFYKKPRPYQIANFVPAASKLFSRLTKKHNAFPSDHALSFSSITFVLLYYTPSIGVAAAVLMVLSAMGRFVLGYHDVWDTVGGWIVGALVAYAVIKFLVPYMILL